MESSRTIAALSSAAGAGAIAVIRLSGPQAFSIVEKCIDSGRAFRDSPARHVKLYRFICPSSGKPVDQITAVKFFGPNSFTGEDMVELFCHGGEIVVEKMLSVLIGEGAYPARRGEFARRGFCNNKFDLMHAEAFLGVIESRSGKEYECSLEALMGTSAGRLVGWRERVKALLRDVDASIEFPEEDDVRKSSSRYIERIVEIRKEIEMEVGAREKSHIIEKGIIIPIVGVANAGKSSLFNMLVGYERSIVHWQEGTTRDGVGEDVHIGGERVTILDTAGLRDTDDPVEKLGISKTIEYVSKAAQVIWVTPANSPMTNIEESLILEKALGKIAVVISKKDLAEGTEKAEMCGKKNIPFIRSCLIGKGDRDALVDFVGEIVKSRIGSLETSSLIRTKRHEIIAKRIIEELKGGEQAVAEGEEILAASLRRVLADFGELVGDTTNEDILDSIFSRFCIGK
jgi:tRNA modification GTPase